MNRLVHAEEFARLLSNYKISAKSEELLQGLKLVLLGGASGSGRNTIVERLIADGGYSFIISDTTRLPRVNNGVEETNGVNYWFRSEEQFLSDLKNGAYLEAEVIHDQQVSGISIRELKKANAAGKIAITDVEIGGFKNIMVRKPDTIGILILPPSLDEWLSRLTGRGPLPEDEITRRLTTGLRVFDEAINNPNVHVIVNTDIEESKNAVTRVVNGEFGSTINGREVAQVLLESTKLFLDDKSAKS